MEGRENRKRRADTAELVCQIHIRYIDQNVNMKFCYLNTKCGC